MSYFLLFSPFFIVCVYMCVIAHGRGQDNLQESATSFYPVGSRDQTQVAKPGDDVPLQVALSCHLARPFVIFLVRSGKL